MLILKIPEIQVWPICNSQFFMEVLDLLQGYSIVIIYFGLAEGKKLDCIKTKEKQADEKKADQDFNKASAAVFENRYSHCDPDLPGPAVNSLCTRQPEIIRFSLQNPP